MRSLNLGILAHVDAGKTTLTERLLYAAGVTREIGSVDKGTTQTDFLALERKRGITIKSAVVSFVVDDVTINLIDTPGHPDFIAEVERVLNVLDGTVLVISAVEGVQSQTLVLMRALQRLRIPTLIFVNKIDRVGARYEGVLEEVSERLTPSVIAMGSVRDLGSRGAGFAPYGASDPGFATGLAELLAGHDEVILAAYVEEKTLPTARLRDELATNTARASVHPVFFGSAITGAGVDALTGAITGLLPAAPAEAGGPISGTVFKVERGSAGEKIAYVRLFSGTLRTRDRVPVGANAEAKVTAINVFEDGSDDQRSSVSAGRIAKVWGLNDVRIGDAIGTPPTQSADHHFAPPTLETVVVPQRFADRGPIHLALAQLAEQDPLIGLRLDEVRQEIHVSLYGEVQKEVVQETLRLDYGLDVVFRETTTICIERPLGSGEAVELKRSASNPFPLGAVGLLIEPLPSGAGVSYRVTGDRLGTMPRAFFAAVEETVHQTLRQGLHGWQVTDCAVTLVHTGYSPRQSHAHQRFNKAMSSTAGDFRLLVPLVLMKALKLAGTVVCEPIHRFRLEIPADSLGTTLPALARMGAVPDAPVPRGRSYVVDGDIPAAHMHELQQQIRALTRGEGVAEYSFDRYEPVAGAIPSRPRTDHNPLNRKEYLLHVLRRV